jgi:hypothetical protein
MCWPLRVIFLAEGAHALPRDTPISLYVYPTSKRVGLSPSSCPLSQPFYTQHLNPGTLPQVESLGSELATTRAQVAQLEAEVTELNKEVRCALVACGMCMGCMQRCTGLHQCSLKRQSTRESLADAKLVVILSACCQIAAGCLDPCCDREHLAHLRMCTTSASGMAAAGTRSPVPPSPHPPLATHDCNVRHLSRVHVLWVWMLTLNVELLEAVVPLPVPACTTLGTF